MLLDAPLAFDVFDEEFDGAFDVDPHPANALVTSATLTPAVNNLLRPFKLIPTFLLLVCTINKL